jgi:hypothetical protein
MNAKPIRMLSAVVALSALAAVLASSAYARIPEGNGTRPPSGTVVHEESLAAALASSAYARIPEGNGTKPPTQTVLHEKQSTQVSGTFFVDPEIYAALASATVAYEQQTRQASVALVDTVYASLDPAFRTAIGARSHAATLGAKAIRTGKGEQLKKFPVGYRGLP